MFLETWETGEEGDKAEGDKAEEEEEEEEDDEENRVLPELRANKQLFSMK
mgnify:CR=1 FL=1